MKRDIHRIGGANVENLRLKDRETKLKQPGISVLRSASPGEAAQQMREAFPEVEKLVEAANLVASTSEELIRSVGFDIIHVPSKTLPNHHRIVHPDGAEGFSDSNLEKLVAVFVNTKGHGP